MRSQILVLACVLVSLGVPREGGAQEAQRLTR